MTTFDTRRPFTRADAIAAGISPAAIRGSRFRRIFHGVYIEARVPSHPLIRAKAALITHPPSSFASHFTSARIQRVAVPAHAFEHVSVLHDSDRSKKDGIKCHLVANDHGVVTVGGVRVSGPARMFVEIASLLSLVDLVVVGDALVRLKRITPEELRAACEASSDRHAAAARRAAAYVRAEVDSPMETRLRMLIVLAGLPEPKVNHELRDEYGNLLMRFDLSYVRIKLIVEYDGRQHGERAKQWLHDLKRREHLDAEKWRIVIVTSEGIYQKPAETIERVRRALKERGYRGLPVRVSSAWRPYFPGR